MLHNPPKPIEPPLTAIQDVKNVAVQVKINVQLATNPNLDL